MTEPTPDPETNPQPWRLPDSVCDKFRATNNRTEKLTPLDVRLGFEQIFVDPLFIETAEYRGQTFGVPPYVERLLDYVEALQSDPETAQLDFQGAVVPEPVQIRLGLIPPPEQLGLF